MSSKAAESSGSSSRAAVQTGARSSRAPACGGHGCVRALVADAAGEGHHHRLRHDRPSGQVEVAPHPFGVDTEPFEHVRELVEQAGRQDQRLRARRSTRSPRRPCRARPRARPMPRARRPGRGAAGPTRSRTRRSSGFASAASSTSRRTARSPAPETSATSVACSRTISAAIRSAAAPISASACTQVAQPVPCGMPRDVRLGEVEQAAESGANGSGVVAERRERAAAPPSWPSGRRASPGARRSSARSSSSAQDAAFRPKVIGRHADRVSVRPWASLRDGRAKPAAAAIARSRSRPIGTSAVRIWRTRARVDHVLCRRAPVHVAPGLAAARDERPKQRDERMLRLGDARAAALPGRTARRRPPRRSGRRPRRDHADLGLGQRERRSTSSQPWISARSSNACRASSVPNRSPSSSESRPVPMRLSAPAGRAPARTRYEAKAYDCPDYDRQ